MPFEFECPHCGIRTNVDDRYSGQSGPCAGCGKTVTIPTIGRGGVTVSPTASGGGAIIAVVVLVGLGALFVCSGMMMWTVRRAVPLPAPAPALTGSTPCDNNLRVLALAMHNYHDAYGTFPPACVAGEDGEPMHSWRVLLLPYLGRKDLYDQYDFDEPWDGPNNRALIPLMPPEYRCPDYLLSNYDATSYAMIVGPGMLSDGESASRMADIKDGTSNTIMFVEAHGARIVWTEPRDLDGGAMSFLINSGQAGELQGHADHVKTVFCDGMTHELPLGRAPGDLRAMATIDGGEVVDIP